MEIGAILWRIDSSTEKQNEPERGNAQYICCHPECIGREDLEELTQ